MAFKDQLAIDMHCSILNLDEFAEEITYIPYGEAPRLIKAIVTRHQIEPSIESQGRNLGRTIELQIANSDAYGVATVTKGKDLCYFSKMLGQGNAMFVVVDIKYHDLGMWHLVVRE